MSQPSTPTVDSAERVDGPEPPRRLTLRDLQNLPPTIDIMTAAGVLGIGRTKAYELAREGAFPVRIIRIGDLYRVATADLLRLVGVGN
jgi:hypothetical protein